MPLFGIPVYLREEETFSARNHLTSAGVAGSISALSVIATGKAPSRRLNKGDIQVNIPKRRPEDRYRNIANAPACNITPP
jgi:hypothetical protein